MIGIGEVFLTRGGAKLLEGAKLLGWVHMGKKRGVGGMFYTLVTKHIEEKDVEKERAAFAEMKKGAVK